MTTHIFKLRKIHKQEAADAALPPTRGISPFPIPLPPRMGGPIHEPHGWGSHFDWRSAIEAAEARRSTPPVRGPEEVLDELRPSDIRAREQSWQHILAADARAEAIARLQAWSRRTT